ncbi:MAG TPA: choice-of-anchor Q domain-containing protein [Rudaea sp.]|jgi:hypothetical protein
MRTRTALAGPGTPGRALTLHRQRRPSAAGSILRAIFLLLVQAAGAHATTYTVATLGDPGPTLQLTLRGAVAMAGSGDTVDFASGLSGTITLKQGEIAITRSLTIHGPGPDVISVSGDAKSRIFAISNADGTPIDVTIDGLTLADGSVKDDNGGAILSNDANLTINRCVIAGNSATGTGGGVAIGGYNWMISDSLIAGNKSGSNGGGLSAFIPYDGIAPASEVTESSSFIGNSSGGSGGAIALSLALIPAPGAPPTGPITIELVNVTITDNTSTSAGGGVFANGGASDVLTIASSTIVDNSASTAGGIDALGTATLIDSIVADNPVLALSGGDLAGTFTANYDLVRNPGLAALNGAHNIVGVDPMLGELGMNGGPTPTLLPAANSPVLDTGDPAFMPPPDDDQRGLPRVANGVIDIGAVERQTLEDDVFRNGFEAD